MQKWSDVKEIRAEYDRWHAVVRESSNAEPMSYTRWLELMLLNFSRHTASIVSAQAADANAGEGTQ